MQSHTQEGAFACQQTWDIFKFFEDLIRSLNASSHDLVVFAISYTLIPHTVYPAQLGQAVEAVRYIVTQTHRGPGGVLIGGDSAGGNLAVGVLSHLSHTHPAIPELKLEGPLAGVILISPWTSLDISLTGVSKNNEDLITKQATDLWSSVYLGQAKRDYCTDASHAPSTWFRNLSTNQMLVLGGGNEIMRPMSEDFVRKVKVPPPSHYQTYSESR